MQMEFQEPLGSEMEKVCFVFAGHMALGPRMLGAFLEAFGVKWASDEAQMGPWMHSNTNMNAQVDKMANLGANWSQLGPLWVHLGVKLGGSRENLGSPDHPWGVLIGSWGQDGPQTQSR